MVTKEDIRKIANAGILAPSGDNCQPWQIYFDGKDLHLVNIPQRDTSLYNINNIASFISFGAMIENMTIVAKSLGYKTSVSLFPKGEDVPLVASIGFTKEQIFYDPLLPFIAKRCVNRKPYKPKKLDPYAMDLLFKAADECKGAKLYLIEKDREKNLLAKLLSLNDRIVFENKELHNFLFEHLRWTRKKAEDSRDGMSIDSLELGWLQSKFMRLLSSWSIVRFLNIFGFSRFVPLQSYNLCKGSSAICLLLNEGIGLDSYVNGGRSLQRIWLTATSLGLSLHPMTGITFLIQRVRSGGEGLSISHKKLLLNIYQRLQKLCPLEEDHSLIMAFRIGYADSPSDKSLRFPLDKVLVEGQLIEGK